MKSVRMRTVLIAFLAVLVGGELAVRLLLERDSAWNMRLGALKQFDPVTLFRLKPNYEMAPGVSTNEHGYLAPPNLTFEKPSDELRIVSLGDSASVQPAEAMYPTQVETILEDRGVRVQTLNAAVPGFDSGKVRALFEREISKYQADFCFVYVGWNDLGIYGPEGLPYKLAREGYEITRFQKFMSQIYVARFLYAIKDFVRRYQPAFDAPLSLDEKVTYDAYYPTHYEENLRAILVLAKRTYPKVVVMNLATITSDDPNEWQLRTAHFPTNMDKNVRKLHQLVTTYNAVVTKVSREENVELIDLFRVFDTEEARREFTDSAHMNAAGTRRMAETAAAVIARTPRESQPAAE